MKTCCHCKQSKPYSEFHKNRSQPDGYAHRCKSCIKEYYDEPKMRSQRNQQKRDYYSQNKEEIDAKQKVYYYTNREEILEKQRERYHTNPSVRERHIASAIKSKHGITAEEYQELYDKFFEAQGGVCRICGMDDKLVLDHNHETGEYRGLLCNKCNRGLGYFQDDPDVLLSAYQYLLGIE